MQAAYNRSIWELDEAYVAVDFSRWNECKSETD